jgi:CheY-like chemotaxis protein
LNSQASGEHTTVNGKNPSESASGVAFDLTLTLASEFSDGSSENLQSPAKETILLVEDEALVRQATAEVLQSAGYRVVIAESATRAWAAYRERTEPLDLLLADVVMPGMSGHELAHQFLTLFPRVRILLMSGYAEQFALCTLSPNSKSYLAKPFSISTLLKKVREVLDNNLLDGCIAAYPTLALR